MCKEVSACNERVGLIFLEKWSIQKWLLEQHESMLLLLAVAQEHLRVRAHWHKVSPFHFTSRSLATGRVCDVVCFLIWGVFLGCVFGLNCFPKWHC